MPVCEAFLPSFKAGDQLAQKGYYGGKFLPGNSALFGLQRLSNSFELAPQLVFLSAWHSGLAMEPLTRKQGITKQPRPGFPPPGGDVGGGKRVQVFPCRRTATMQNVIHLQIADLAGVPL